MTLDNFIHAFIAIYVLTHINCAVYSIYIHRAVSHGSMIVHPVLEQIFIFILWFTRGFNWPQWRMSYAANHRKHHMYSDKPGDPHSPYEWSIWKLFSNYENQDPNGPHYTSREEILKLASDISPHEFWVEKHIYQKYPKFGLLVCWALFTYFFSWWGFIIGFSFIALRKHGGTYVGVWNSHFFGPKFLSSARTGQSKQSSPWGILFAGEEVHENHHQDTRNPNFARRWYEFDMGYIYARIFRFFGLIKFANDK